MALPIPSVPPSDKGAFSTKLVYNEWKFGWHNNSPIAIILNFSINNAGNKEWNEEIVDMVVVKMAGRRRR